MSILARNHLPIVREEFFNVNGLKDLLNSKAVSDQDKKYLKAYKKRARNSGNNKVAISYDFAKEWQTIQKGRLYPTPYTSSQTGFPSQIRAVLAEKFYWDIDVVNCQPVLAIQIAKRYNILTPSLEEYCLRRDEIFDEMMKETGMTRDEVKTEWIRVMFGGTSFAHPLIQRVKKELTMLAAVLKEDNLDIYNNILRLKEEQRKKSDPLFSCLAVYLQNEERLCLLALDEYVCSKGRHLDVLNYDGAALRKLPNETALPSSFLSDAEAAVKAKTSYTIYLKVKPYEHSYQFEKTDFVYPIDAVIDDLFACRMLVQKNPDTFLLDGKEIFMTNPITGLWQPFDLEDAKTIVVQSQSSLVFRQETAMGIRVHNYSGNQKNVLSMLSYLGQCIPSGEVPIEFLGSLGEPVDLETQESRRVIELYTQLLSLISNHNKEKLDYLLKYLAHAVQKPRMIPGVCLVITGGQGCGKDTTFKIFMNYVLGPTYATSYDKNEHFFNPYDSSKARKVMLRLEEANAKFCSENSHSLKALVTNDKIKINPKLKKEYEVSNFARCIFTTNEGNPINLEGEDRRYVLYDCSMEKAKNREFWNVVYSTLFTTKAGQILYHYFKSIDIETFDVMTFPVSEYQQEVQEAWKTVEEKFLEDWDGEEANLETIFTKYRQFCLRLKIKEDSICNRMTFGRRLTAFSRDNKIQRRQIHGYPYYSKPEADPLIE